MTRSRIPLVGAGFVSSLSSIQFFLAFFLGVFGAASPGSLQYAIVVAVFYNLIKKSEALPGFEFRLKWAETAASCAHKN